jgi:hypothetical protein
MQNIFKVDQDLSFKEFLSSTLYYYLTGRRTRKYFAFMTALGILSTIFGFMTSSNGVGLSDIPIYLAPAIMLFFGMLDFIVLVCFVIYKFKPYLFKNVSYEFTHCGVVRHGERTEFSKPWREITNLKETKAFFLLYIGNTDFHIIQKRMFPDTEKLETFRDCLVEWFRD